MSQLIQQTPWFVAVLTTSNATPTSVTAAAFTPPSNISGVCECHIVAHLLPAIGGSNAVGVFHVKRAYKNVSGTVSLVGIISVEYVDIVSIGLVDCSVVLSGSSIQPQVTGLSSTSIEWTVSARYDVN